MVNHYEIKINILLLLSEFFIDINITDLYQNALIKMIYKSGTLISVKKYNEISKPILVQ